MSANIKELVELVTDRPWTIFLIATLALGYAYYELNASYLEMVEEVSGLRAEQVKMNEIIKLKIELAKATGECE